METVKAYKTEDGKVFVNKDTALTHELMISFRGLINRNNADRSVSEVLNVFAQNADEVHSLILDFKKRRTRPSYKKTKKVNKADA